MGLLGDFWREFVATFKGWADAGEPPRKRQNVRVDAEFAEVKDDFREDRALRKRWKEVKRARTSDEREKARQAMLDYMHEARDEP